MDPTNQQFEQETLIDTANPEQTNSLVVENPPDSIEQNEQNPNSANPEPTPIEQETDLQSGEQKNASEKLEVFQDFLDKSYILQLPARPNEVTSQYKNRKLVYEAAMNDLKDHEKAFCIANVWANMTYLGVKYQKNVEENALKYAPQIC